MLASDSDADCGFTMPWRTTGFLVVDPTAKNLWEFLRRLKRYVRAITELFPSSGDCKIVLNRPRINIIEMFVDMRVTVTPYWTLNSVSSIYQLARSSWRRRRRCSAWGAVLRCHWRQTHILSHMVHGTAKNKLQHFHPNISLSISPFVRQGWSIRPKPLPLVWLPTLKP